MTKKNMGDISPLKQGLTFNTLREANKLRIPTFRNKKGEQIHNEDGSDWSIAEWYEALSGEAGEFANWHKKFRRGELTQEEFLVEAKKELADVQIYLDILAFRLGIDLGEAVRAKFNEVSRRVNSPIIIALEAETGENNIWDLRWFEPSDSTKYYYAEIQK